ncbi:MAG: hypothetical protein GTO51_06280 [Candidatus Latescibacteria bacterium]|nr:hypothetical protein [Candidatus Latescibacterota bacterium]NIM21398.1 hypothetical protein [Candidatus Latescibacterota bacterium]NIM65579.1 hypothetical protein [Candidatus Latescibacterota bacterium]NIO01959.1 hypothetical protein [Candidatus Latescibacterota bacterium]NIO28772.1 hypothetical protein [Candidatus Latescibacterota bacterium]
MKFSNAREIIYINSDDFFASVVRLRDPALKSRPVVVGHLSSRGVVLAASYEARAEGIHPGLTIPQARRLSPSAAFVQVDWALFRRASDALFSLVRRYSPLVEPVSLDEGFMDYTGCARLFGEVKDTAWRVQKKLAAAPRLTVSLGLGPNKLVSQVASKVAKRGGIVTVSAGEEREFLAPFPLSWLPGIRPSHRETLSSLGIKTIGALSQVPPPLAECVLGSFGKTLVERAGGMDNRRVRSDGDGEIVEKGITFRNDMVELSRIDAELYMLSEALGRELRRRGQGARKLRLRLSYTDGYEATHGARLGEVCHSDRRLYEEAVILLKRAYTRRVKVRALHLAAARPVPLTEQMDLFQCENGKLARLYRACDMVREKYPGEKILCFGKTFAPDEDEAAANAVLR